MEGQCKGSINGMEGVGSKGKEEVAVTKHVPSAAYDFLLRLLALILTLAAAIVAGTDKQTKVIAIKFLDTLPPLNVPVTAKWQHLSAFMEVLCFSS